MLFRCSAFYTQEEGPIDTHYCDAGGIQHYINRIGQNTDPQRPVSVKVEMKPHIFNLKRPKLSGIRREKPPNQDDSPSVCEILNRGD